jgi:protein-tyrosine phosphatase
MADQTKILFVCMGNICRSPTAEGVMRKLIAEGPLVDLVEIDSAGTIGHHIGSPPDARSVAHAAKRGIDLTPLRARQIERGDFSRFDYVLAMDTQNIKHLQTACPSRYATRLRLLLEFAPERGYLEVPDPYYGDDRDFELVLDLVEHGCRGLHRHLLEKNNVV